ncbi:MAG: Crp/Fnr family transcriptional regulator [Arcticibacter sp.]
MAPVLRIDFDLHQCFLNIFAATLTFSNVIDTITMALADLIQKITVLNEEQLATVISCFKSVVVKRKEQLLEHGAIANRLFFINKGCLRLYYCNNDQNIITRFMAFENTFLTSIVSFISREPSAEYIQAVETSELLVITYEDFSYLRRTIPEWDKMYIHILEYGLTVITSKLSNLLTQSAADRYRNLLKNNPELIQRLSNSNLAAYMNISPETLSRLKSQI